MRVAIVHHWFVTRGGGERVAERFLLLFPQAELFTLVASPEGLPRGAVGHKLHTSFLQRLPFARTHHRHMLPLYPAATESLDLRGFDLVLTSDAGPIKGVRLSPGAVQICYCHSPMRYLYDSYEQYLASMTGLTRLFFRLAAGRVRAWDLKSAAKVTHFVANSRYVAERIRRTYHRESTVIHPPIDLYLARKATPGDHYLCAGRLVPYKCTELAIEACAALNRPLRIAGTGPEEPRLRKLAAALNAPVVFLGELTTDALWNEYAHCRALLFSADEDFGMVPLEAQACGRPVICFGAGGSLETVRGTGPKPTGVYFPEQTSAAMQQAIQHFEANEATFSPQTAKAWAETFATPIFLARIRAFVLRHVPAAAEAMLPFPAIQEPS
ncbi:glycosyltransferase [Granulicella tundricola]|uniref:Glycosyl transferase group 1 n=1 Tax=Granulicella tundricola (strain ATCC BAA-1859 / DSM 23138 / MP5ACTX9) TaxID=1198114 RepID=E8WW52_GRATM|nr:glycosyltransferase [Granulicella tundricola]ADW67358.1 glycosyl transferase group 1 [Granulicella tundricola MP5ACTX9]